MTREHSGKGKFFFLAEKEKTDISEIFSRFVHSCHRIFWYNLSDYNGIVVKENLFNKKHANRG